MAEATAVKTEQNTMRKQLFLRWVLSCALFAFVFVYTEVCLHVLVFGMPTKRIVYPMLFGLCCAALCAAVCLSLPPLAQRIVGTLVCFLEVFWAEVQYVYQAAFGGFMPLNQLALGGNVGDFRSQVVYELERNVPQVLALAVPLLGWIVLLCLRKLLRTRFGWRSALACLAAAAAFAGTICLGMYATRGAEVSVLSLFTSPDTETTTSFKAVGMAATTAQELRFMLLPPPEEVLEPLPDETEPEQDEPGGWDRKLYNVLPIDFAALRETTDDETLRYMDRYFSALTPTSKNEYTGLLRGFNVIVLCAESYSPNFVSEELTPTLYRMLNNGFVFRNFYGCFKAITTNGEYSLCTGLQPDKSRSKTDSTFDATIGHYLPFCLGNLLGAKGYQTYAYHNYIGEFYNRNLTHPNMGYTFKAADSGLNVTGQWPASDLEMMESSMDDYLASGEPFAAYYMTFSGHYQYDWFNAMSAKHRDRVRDLPYSETVQAYIACNLEVEDALTYILARLEQAGVADRTLIVLTGDHYPYGLTEEEYNELSGREIDVAFEKYRNSFLCYTPAITEPVVVDDYCCTVDILPTVLNLLGESYDSRLLAGTDVFSDGPHVAVLDNGNFLTNEFRYDAETGEVTPHKPGAEVSAQTLADWKRLVKNKDDYSRRILRTDYYRHALSITDLDEDGEKTYEFTDVDKIYMQASVSWLLNRGYFDPVSETEFGANLHATVGEYVDSLYRVAGRPKTDPSLLPEGYAEARNDPERLAVIPADENDPVPCRFDESYPYYDAVCWAFETGILRADELWNGHDSMISYRNVAVAAARFCVNMGVELRLAEQLDEDGKPIDRLKALAETFPGLTEEELTACIWVYDEHIISLDADLITQMYQIDSVVPRGTLVSYIFRVCNYELQHG